MFLVLLIPHFDNTPAYSATKKYSHTSVKSTIECACGAHASAAVRYREAEEQQVFISIHSRV
jgi:hypothetical protein